MLRADTRKVKGHPFLVAGREPLPPELGAQTRPRAVVLVSGELAADPQQAALGDGHERRPRRRAGVGAPLVPASSHEASVVLVPISEDGNL